MSSCPTTTPASSVPTTLPRLKPPKRRRPIVNPMASVRKIASSGFPRTDVANQSMAGSLAWRESNGSPADAVLSVTREEVTLSERIVLEDARRQTSAALDRLEAACRAAGLPDEAVIDLRVVAEEVLTNVAKYAFEPGVSPAVELLVQADDAEAVLEFRDRKSTRLNSSHFGISYA